MDEVKTSDHPYRLCLGGSNVRPSYYYNNVYLYKFIILGGYPNGYGNAPWLPGGESRKDCAIVPGLDSALCFAFRSDNTGPPKSFSVISFFALCFTLVLLIWDIQSNLS